MSQQRRRAQQTRAPSLAPSEAGGRQLQGFGSNAERARQLASQGDAQAMLDAQAGDVDALLGGWSSFAPQLEVMEDAVYGDSAVVGALTAAARDPIFAECAFGETTRDLRDAPHLLVQCNGHFVDAASLPGLVAAQFVAGLEEEGWADGGGVAELFAENVDEEGIYVNTITLLATGESFDWLEFFMGDTEVGYLFRGGTNELVGCVGDGEIYGCSVQLPSLGS